MNAPTVAPFSSYQRIVILILGGLLFTVILDFMLLPALSSTLLDELALTTREFGWVVSAYAFSAGLSALLSSGFADRFDRKKYLMFFYGGFLVGITLCCSSTSFPILLSSRIITGIFGGVVASIAYAMVTDLFHADQRGRAMGLLQVAFALSLVGGLPFSLYLSSKLPWQCSYAFILVVGISFFVWIGLSLKPLTAHLHSQNRISSWQHLLSTLTNNHHALVFFNNTSIVFADVLFMTFFAAYCTHNLGVLEDELPILYGVGGLTALLSGPFLGQLADRTNQVMVFWGGTLLAACMVLLYVLLEQAALWQLIIIQSILFVGITARQVSSTALATLASSPGSRGAFMALDASIQQLAAGLAAVAAGWIVYEAAEGQIRNFGHIGWSVGAFMVLSTILTWRIHRIVRPTHCHTGDPYPEKP